MYGTIMRAKVKPGRRGDFIRLQERREGQHADPGFVSMEWGWEDKDDHRLVAIIRFRDRESYMANAERPETDTRFREMVELFEGAPEWTDLQFAGFSGEPIAPYEAATTGS